MGLRKPQMFMKHAGDEWLECRNPVPDVGPSRCPTGQLAKPTQEIKRGVRANSRRQSDGQCVRFLFSIAGERDATELPRHCG